MQCPLGCSCEGALRHSVVPTVQGAAWEPHRQQRSTTEQVADAGQGEAQRAAAVADAAGGPAADGPEVGRSADGIGGGNAAGDEQQAAAQEPQQQQRAAGEAGADSKGGATAAGEAGASSKGGATAAVEVLKDDSSAMIDPAATDPQVPPVSSARTKCSGWQPADIFLAICSPV
jgi:hypothetical protein